MLTNPGGSCGYSRQKRHAVANEQQQVFFAAEATVRHDQRLLLPFGQASDSSDGLLDRDHVWNVPRLLIEGKWMMAGNFHEGEQLDGGKVVALLAEPKAGFILILGIGVDRRCVKGEDRAVADGFCHLLEIALDAVFVLRERDK